MVMSMIITIARIMLMMILMVVIIIIDLTHYGDYDENYHAWNLGSNDGSGDCSAISTSSTIRPSPDSQAHETEDITDKPSWRLRIS